MRITRTSTLTGITRTLDVSCTAEQYENWARGMVIQKAMPNISADEREFIISGITPDEWDKEFKDDS